MLKTEFWCSGHEQTLGSPETGEQQRPQSHSSPTDVGHHAPLFPFDVVSAMK